MKQISILILGLSLALFMGSSFTEGGSYEPEVFQAQKVLRVLGYNPGKLDGIWGKVTQRAIESFQRDSGLPVTGRLDEETKAKLGIKSFNPLFQGLGPLSSRDIFWQ